MLLRNWSDIPTDSRLEGLLAQPEWNSPNQTGNGFDVHLRDTPAAGSESRKLHLRRPTHARDGAVVSAVLAFRWHDSRCTARRRLCDNDLVRPVVDRLEYWRQGPHVPRCVSPQMSRADQQAAREHEPPDVPRPRVEVRRNGQPNHNSQCHENGSRVGEGSHRILRPVDLR